MGPLWKMNWDRVILVISLTNYYVILILPFEFSRFFQNIKFGKKTQKCMYFHKKNITLKYDFLNIFF